MKIPVVRFYNPSNGHHHPTANVDERRPCGRGKTRGPPSTPEEIVVLEHDNPASGPPCDHHLEPEGPPDSSDSRGEAAASRWLCRSQPGASLEPVRQHPLTLGEGRFCDLAIIEISGRLSPVPDREDPRIVRNRADDAALSSIGAPTLNVAAADIANPHVNGHRESTC